MRALAFPCRERGRDYGLTELVIGCSECGTHPVSPLPSALGKLREQGGGQEEKSLLHDLVPDGGDDLVSLPSQ